MSTNQTQLGIVGQTIKDLLGVVNSGFNWDIIEDRYDEDPENVAMSLHFTNEEGQEPVEEIYLAIDEGPSIVVLDTLNDSFDYLGAVVTYQDFGLRILDPDDDMTPDRARYQHSGITIHPAEGVSKERTWMVISNVLDIMLESVVYQQTQAEAGGKEGGA